MYTYVRQSFEVLLSDKWSIVHKTALWTAVLAISYLATTSIEHTVQSTFSDKFNHFIAFAVLTFLSHIAYPGSSMRNMATLLFSYGLLIEVTQYFLPHREFSLLDLATDVLGIACYWLVFYTFIQQFIAPNTAAPSNKIKDSN